MKAFLFPPSRLLRGWGPSFLCSSQFWKNSNPQSAKCQSPLTICVVPWGSWASTKPTRGDPPGDGVHLGQKDACVQPSCSVIH